MAGTTKAAKAANRAPRSTASLLIEINAPVHAALSIPVSLELHRELDRGLP
jgi:hypothetical protein